MAGLDPDTAVPFERAAPDAGAVQHVPQRGPAADADRQPGPGVDPAALNPAPNPSVGDPLCAGLPEGTPCQYLYYVLANEDGGHAFAVTAEQHQANVPGGGRRRPASSADRNGVRVAAVIGSPVAHSLSPALHNAAFAAAGLDWVYVAFDVAPARRPRRSTACARHRRALGDDAAQGGRSPRRSTSWPGRRRAAVGEHRGATPTVAWSVTAPTATGSWPRWPPPASTSPAPRSPSSAPAPAARSVVDALGRAGAAESSSSTARPGEPSWPAGGRRPHGVGRRRDRGRRRRQRHVGRDGHRRPAVRRPLLRPGQVVADLVYHPLRDGAAAGAASRGCRPSTGSGCSSTRPCCSRSCGPASPDPAIRRAAPSRPDRVSPATRVCWPRAGGVPPGTRMDRPPFRDGARQ